MKSTRILAALVVAVAATVGGFYAGHVFTGGDSVAAGVHQGCCENFDDLAAATDSDDPAVSFAADSGRFRVVANLDP